MNNVLVNLCASNIIKWIKRSLINNYILILEDDVCFIKEFNYIMKALEEAPDDFNILHLEGFYWPGEEDQHISSNAKILRKESGFLQKKVLGIVLLH